MKKFILCMLCALAIGFSSHADTTVVRKGDNFSVTQVQGQSKEVKTKYTFTTKDGKTYPVYMGPKGGFYIKRVSKKTGKEYHQALPKDVQAQLKKEMKK